MTATSYAPLRAGNGGVITEQLDALPESGISAIGVNAAGKLSLFDAITTDETVALVEAAIASIPAVDLSPYMLRSEQTAKGGFQYGQGNEFATLRFTSIDTGENFEFFELIANAEEGFSVFQGSSYITLGPSSVQMSASNYVVSNSAAFRTAIGLGTGDSPTFANMRLPKGNIVYWGDSPNAISVADSPSWYDSRSNVMTFNLFGGDQFTGAWVFRDWTGILSNAMTITCEGDVSIRRDVAIGGNLNASGLISAFKSNVSTTSFEALTIDAAAVDGSTPVYRIGSRIGEAGGATRGLQFGNWNAAGAWTNWININTNGNLSFASAEIFGNISHVNPFGQRYELVTNGGVFYGLEYNGLSVDGGVLKLGIGDGCSYIAGGQQGYGIFHVFVGSVTSPRLTILGDGGVLIPGNVAISGDLTADSLPTSDPGVAGRIWRSGNDLKISTG